MKSYLRCKIVYILVWSCFALVMLINIMYNMTFKFQTVNTCNEGHHIYSPTRSFDSLKSMSERIFLRDKTEGNAADKKRASKVARDEGKDHIWLQIEAQSDREHVYLALNGIRVYEIKETDDRSRGLHVIVVNQNSGDLMVNRVFDFYNGDDNSDFASFINSIQQGRIVVFFIKDEASIGFETLARKAVQSFGSKLVHNLGYREHWVCIARRKSGWLVEDISKRSAGASWPKPVKVGISVKLDRTPEGDEKCDNIQNEESYRRKEFCQMYEGYESVCDCSKGLYKKPPRLKKNNVAHFPIVIIATKRPRYLFKMLRKLLSVSGADRRMITVYIDGDYNETKAVAGLFGLNVVVNQIECTGNCRVQQHYRKSLSRAFDDFSDAKAAIILEDDLEVSDDIFDYFSQTFPLLEVDSSIYCISAWNDQGYIHSVNDSSLLYRVETMPGLGW